MKKKMSGMSMIGVLLIVLLVGGIAEAHAVEREERGGVVGEVAAAVVDQRDVDLDCLVHARDVAVPLVEAGLTRDDVGRRPAVPIGA